MGIRGINNLIPHCDHIWLYKKIANRMMEQCFKCEAIK